jgi:hypothetical protein
MCLGMSREPTLRDVSPCDGKEQWNFEPRSYHRGDRKKRWGLAGSRGARQLCCGLLSAFVAQRHRAGCRCILVRRCVCLPKKCAAGFFKRILRHCVRLIHLGLLISSWFVLRSASSQLSNRLQIRARRGLAPWCLDQIVSRYIQRPSATYDRREQVDI